MASPFTIFRKHQGVMLAVFGVLIMLVFVVGDSISKWAGGGSGASFEDPVVVEVAGRKLRQSELGGKGDMRGYVANFLARAQGTAVQRGAFGEQAQLALRFGFPLPTQPIIRSDQLTSEDTVRVMIMAEKARQLGMVVTDDEITKYLLDLVDRKLTPKELRTMIEGDGTRGFVTTQKNAYQIIRDEMLASRLLTEFFRGTMARPMAQQLEYYERLNRRVQAEVLAVPVDQFLGEVAEPSDRELQKYFDKYKTRLQPLDVVSGRQFISGEPGFKLPQRVSVEYVKANVDDFMDEARAAITEDDIEKYYEENKDSDEKLHAQEDLLPKLDEASSDTDTTTDPKDGEDATGDAKNDAPETPDSQPEVPECDDAEAAADDSEIKPGDGDAADEPVDDTKTSPEEKGSPAEAGKEDEDAAAAEDASGDTNEATEATEAAASDGKEEAKPDEKKKPSYKPLDEVRDYIHQQLTRERADALISEKFSRIRSSMEAYNQALAYAAEEEPPSQPRPDFETLAKENGLKALQKTDLSARTYVEETGIGASSQPGAATSTNPFPQPTPFVALAFREGEQSLFRPTETMDDEGNRYLFWKTAEREAEVPKLEDVRETVVAAWKRGAGLEETADKGRGLARKRAQELAEQLGQGKTLDEIAAAQEGGEIAETEWFSWLTRGSAPPVSTFQPPPLAISDVEGVDQPGTEFMRVVFDLAPGEAGVAMNHQQSEAYLIRLKAENKSMAVLQQNFLDELDDQRVLQQVETAARLDWDATRSNWFDDMDKEFDVVWLRPDLRR